MIYVILGMLMIKNLTIYEVKNYLEGNLSPFYSGSYGSIQAAVKKLLANEQISFEEKIENGRNKKIYSITQKGKEEFHKWLETEIQVTKLKDNALTRLFFFGFLEKGKRIRLVEGYIKSLKNNIKEFSDFQNERLKKELPQHLNEIANYQMITLQYGIDHLEFDIKWYENLLNDMKGE